jgi:hypothetical protein
MENQLKRERKRKLMLILPVLVLPFITLIFWALGGGRGYGTESSEKKIPGVNLRLPDAQISEEAELDKMGYYTKAKKDSIKFQEMLRNDPSYRETGPMEAHAQQFDGYPAASTGMNNSLYGSGYNDPNTQKIYDRLSMLNRELARPGNGNPYQEPYPMGQRGANALKGSEVDRLEQMMNMMGQPEGDDPEMRQLNGMLEKILDIQHPDRVRQKLKEGSDAKRGTGLCCYRSEEGE